METMVSSPVSPSRHAKLPLVRDFELLLLVHYDGDECKLLVDNVKDNKSAKEWRKSRFPNAVGVPKRRVIVRQQPRRIVRR
jgi:hypothetical protein